MACAHFNSIEEKTLIRVLVLKDLITAQSIHESPCRLLLTQLNEMNVMCSILQRNITELMAITQKAVSSD